MGNGDREDARRGPRAVAAHRELVASFEPVVAIDGVLYCHGTPRSDEEIMTRISPPERLERILRDVDEKVVVCGHVHQQYDREVGRWRIVNAGSVGLPYEGRPGAFWALLEDGEPQLRRTAYDVTAVEALPDNELYRESLLEPADPGGSRSSSRTAPRDGSVIASDATWSRRRGRSRRSR